MGLAKQVCAAVGRANHVHLGLALEAVRTVVPEGPVHTAALQALSLTRLDKLKVQWGRALRGAAGVPNYGRRGGG